MCKKWLAFAAVLGLAALIDPIHSEAQPPSGKGPPGGFGGNKGGGDPRFQPPGGGGGDPRFQRPGGGGDPRFQGGPQPGQPMVVQVQGQPGATYSVQQQPGGGDPRFQRPGGGGDPRFQGGPQGPGGGGDPRFQGGPQGPGGDPRSSRGPGGGGGQMDPDRLFQMLVNVSGGRDTIRFDNIPPETKAVMRQMSERMGTPPMPETGEWTKSQFMEYYQRNQAIMQSRQGGPQGPGGSSGDDRGAQRLKEQDRDGDGRVSRAEADRMLQPNFDRIDANGDGYITLEEYRGYYASRDNGGNNNNGNRDPRNDQNRPNDPYAGGFYDQGRDGRDNRDQKKEPEVAIRYGKLPKDAPGYFTEYDMNKDGQLELSEWRLNSGDLRDFIKYDMDGDGILTYSEYQRYKEQQASLGKTKTTIDPETGEEVEVPSDPGSSPRSNPIAGGNGGGNQRFGPGGGNNGGQRPSGPGGNSGGKDSGNSGGGSNPFRNGGKK